LAGCTKMPTLLVGYRESSDAAVVSSEDAAFAAGAGEPYEAGGAPRTPAALAEDTLAKAESANSEETRVDRGFILVFS